MTPAEHEILALRMREQAQRVVIDWMAGVWRAQYGLAPEPGRSQSLKAMEARLSAAQAEYSTIAMPWLDAASSDMQAALFQEAFEEISKKVLATIGAGLTPEEQAKLAEGRGTLPP